MRCIPTPVRLVLFVGVLSALACSAPFAYAQGDQSQPSCDPAVPSALQFEGLPERIPYGQTEEYGFVRNPASDRSVPGPVVLAVLEAGRGIYEDATSDRGDDLYLLTLYIDARAVRVYLTFVEIASDGSTCQRVLSRQVRGFPDGRRFEAWVERAGSRRPAHSFHSGVGLSFVFKDRFARDTPYRLCWQRANGTKRKCRPHRAGEARRPDTLFASAPMRPGRWVATWRTGGLIVATWAFKIAP